MGKCLTAYTKPGVTYPGYINFTREDDGTVSVYLRGNPEVREDRAYICGHPHEKGRSGRCTAGDDRCNNYCNMAPEKGPMQKSPAPCTQIICGDTVKLTLSNAEFDAFVGELWTARG